MPLGLGFWVSLASFIPSSPMIKTPASLAYAGLLPNNLVEVENPNVAIGFCHAMLSDPCHVMRGHVNCPVRYMQFWHLWHGCFTCKLQTALRVCISASCVYSITHMQVDYKEIRVPCRPQIPFLCFSFSAICSLKIGNKLHVYQFTCQLKAVADSETDVRRRKASAKVHWGLMYRLLTLVI